MSTVNIGQEDIRQQPKVKSFLDRKRRNSANTAGAYLQGLTALQKFLMNFEKNEHENENKVSVNDVSSLFPSTNVYEFLDSFVAYLITDCRLSSKTVSLYLAAVKGYLEHCDVEINPTKFKNKVTMPKNHREDEAAIDDADIRKILLACNNFRLKVYLLVLASGGLRAREATAIRIKDIDFTITPTKIHVRAEYTKTKVARDIYISEEATTYLKQFIDKKYSEDSLNPQIKQQHWNDRRFRDEHADDLVFRMYNPNESRPNDLYNKLLIQFQRLLKAVGLEERKEGVQRRKVTFHSLRRFSKTMISTHTSTDYSEWFLGHCKSPYFVLKEHDRRLLYASKCMPHLTFLDYSKLESDAAKKQSDIENLMVQNAKKDRQIEELKKSDTANAKRIAELEEKYESLSKQYLSEMKQDTKLMLKETDVLNQTAKQIRKLAETEAENNNEPTEKSAIDVLQLIKSMLTQISDIRKENRKS